MTAALPTALLIHTVTWIAPTPSTDSYGNIKYTYGSGTSISGRMEQHDRKELITEGRDALEGHWTLFTNQDGISGRDRIVFNSMTFEVWGPVEPKYGAGAFHHAEVYLRKIDG